MAHSVRKLSGLPTCKEERIRMDIFSVLTMLGGLAMFLYGMETMGGGLSRLSGGRMEQLLEKIRRRT